MQKSEKTNELSLLYSKMDHTRTKDQQWTMDGKG